MSEQHGNISITTLRSYLVLISTRTTYLLLSGYSLAIDSLTHTHTLTHTHDPPLTLQYWIDKIENNKRRTNALVVIGSLYLF